MLNGEWKQIRKKSLGEEELSSLVTRKNNNEKGKTNTWTPMKSYLHLSGIKQG